MDSEKQLEKEPQSPATIRFQDCDPFGHLNNGRYVDYFMNARTDHLAEHYGLSPYSEERAESWVTSKSQIAFLFPARMGEQVLIRTRLIHFDERTIVIEGLMLNQAGTRLKALLWMEFTYVSLSTGRPAQHSDEFMQLFGGLRVDGYATGFDARAGELRRQFRRQGEAVSDAA